MPLPFDEPITNPSQLNPLEPGPIVAPGPELGTQPIAPVDTGLGIKYKGPTAAGAARATGMRGQIDSRVNQFQQQDAAITGQLGQQYQQGIEGQKAGIEQQQQAQRDFVAEQQIIDTKRQALFQEAARQEEEAREKAKISTAEFNQSYQEQLAAIRGMSVNIAGPLAQLSDAQMGGLSFALFAQGFLAAKGVNINVSQQVDRWVERSIREQERQIEQKQQGLQQSINMWQLARQASADDLEARMRYRGWIVEGLKAQTELSAARFNSALATSQAAVAISKLDADSAMTRNELLNQNFTRTLQRSQYETDTAYKIAQVNLEQQELQLKKQAAASKTGEAPKFKIITDPTTGKATWIIRENRIGADEDSKVATKAAEDYGALENQIKKAINFHKEIKGQYGHGWIDRIDDVKREYAAMVTAIASETSRGLFGLNATDKEFERISKLVPFEKWYESGSNENIWANFRENARDKFDQVMRQRAEAIPPEMQSEMPHNVANPGGKAEFEARKVGKEPERKFASFEEAKVSAKDSNKIEQSYGSKLFGHFTKTWRNDAIKKAGYDQKYFDLVYDGKPGAYSNLKMKGHSVAIDHLVNAYLNPETVKELGDKGQIYEGTQNETTESISRDAYRALKQIASGKTGDGRPVPPEAEKYAEYIISLSDDDLRNAWETDPDRLVTSSVKSSQEPSLDEFIGIK